ncbi:tumor necrosis factor receptor superfamily member wengen isoform X2 [Coccinella septempunctata]|uniref:tumor necrosis factor receptor superfamily member wengen isoform X2 n=1 Tax=Coccinella septempunctata TaxID=41139 RepID=UPI001D07C54A|nr:tumor necrosis factor receptor superfamily member wengen isoform X2 [Coccinella septempunctata]
MGIHRSLKVMVSGYSAVVFITLFTWTVAAICEQGKTFHHADLQQCVNCTVCKEGEVVIRPCEIHRDTHCGVLNLRDILKFVTPEPTVSQNPHRHHKHRNHNHKDRSEQANWKYPDGDVRTDYLLYEQTVEPEKVAPFVSSTEMPFSSAETIVWDWQAIALSSAVFTCILFFLVITLYSLHQAKQWRRLKETFEADVEELSASLMAAAGAQAKSSDVEKGEDHLSQSTKSKMGSEGNYLNRCVYLEQLLNVRKDNKNRDSRVGGNVYIAPKISLNTKP